ncbi:MAG: AIPR family protein [Elusimicrobia bacterium]|nr:AIPR family protein [Elusimicrobiota bacterium]
MGKIAKELSGLLGKEFPGEPRWRTFVKWWLDAKGYDYRSNRDLLVDGKGDGGIDVIARPNPELGSNDIFVVQSKYFQNSPPQTALERFLSAIKAIQGNRNKFDDWLNSVHTDLRRTYRTVREQRRYVRFILITSARLDSKIKRYLKKENVEFYDQEAIGALLESYKRGQTPRATSIIVNSGKPTLLIKSPAHRLWCARISLRSLGEAYSKHGDTLFAGNVRYALRGENPKNVREGIKKTATQKPREFIYFHNGITIVSRRLTRKGMRLKIDEPSIVNGAQTVSFIGKNLLERVPRGANLLAKIVEVMPGFPYEQLETDIALSSNTQNKVDFSDLSVADPALVRIERGFRRYDCFLERKKGTSPGFRPKVRITKERLVQLFTAINNQLGPTYAKSPQALFKRNRGYAAQESIRLYGRSIKGIEDSIFLAKLDSMCRSALRYSNKRKNQRAKTAYFAVFAAYINALKNTYRWNALRREIINAPDHRASIFWKDVRGHVRSAAQKMLRLSAKQRKNEPAFYKNKTQVDHAVQAITKKIRSGVGNGYRD